MWAYGDGRDPKAMKVRRDCSNSTFTSTGGTDREFTSKSVVTESPAFVVSQEAGNRNGALHCSEETQEERYPYSSSSLSRCSQLHRIVIGVGSVSCNLTPFGG